MPRSMTVWAHCKSTASIVFITLNLLFWCVPLLLLGILKLVVPPSRRFVDRLMAHIYRTALRIDDWWLNSIIGIRWDRPPLDLDRDRSYFVLSNHASWSDILLIQSVITRDGPPLKFLVKRELIMIPIFGLIFWAFDFPLLRRRSRAGEDDAERRRGDLESLRTACRVMRTNPAALMNFAEGTRFNPEKREAMKSPYRHLLVPRLGGFVTMLDALEGDIDAIVDLTLIYPRPPSFWGFLAGEFRSIRIEAELVPREAIPALREDVNGWLSRQWSRKDERLERART